MSREEAIRWARQAGWSEIGADLWGAANDGAMSTYALTRFAAQAHAAGAAAERATCIEDCNAEARDDGTAQRIVERIQARGEA
jgi:hypothetical protein